MKITLLENAVQDETGATEAPFKKSFLFSAFGTWGTATVTFQISIDGISWAAATYEDGSDVVLSTDKLDKFCQFIPNDYSVRAIVTGGNGTTDLTSYIIG